MKVTESNLNELKFLINKKVWLMMKSKARYIGTLKHINRKKGKVSIHDLIIINDKELWVVPKTDTVRDFKIEKILYIHEWSYATEFGE